MVNRNRVCTTSIFRSAARLSIALMWPLGAEAHVGIQSGALLAGAVHPWLTPTCAFILIALALWICQYVKTDTELAPFLALALCLTAGATVGLAAPVFPPHWGLGLVAVTLASCVSLAIRPPRLVWLGIVAVAAALAGFAAGADAAHDVSSPIFFLAGVTAGGLVLPLTAALVLMDRRWPGLPIAIRIASSWVAAIALIGMAL